MKEVTCLIIALLFYSTHAGTYEQYFSPAEEEYEMKFDPNTMFGSPLGGYSRATRSRLAALPVRLVGDAIFWDVDEKMERKTSNHASSDPFFTLRDGDGREFACRVYSENDLTFSSFHDSMFEQAIEIPNGSNKEETYRNKPLDLSSTYSHDTETNNDDVMVEYPDDSIHNKLDFKLMTDAEALPKEAILQSLKELEGICLEHVLNFWSYRYCYQDIITQYHFEISQQLLEQGLLSITNDFDDLIQKRVTVIGMFKSRTIVIDDDPYLWTYYEDDDDAEEEDSNTDKNERMINRVVIGMDSITVVDKFDGGDDCGQGLKKSAEVYMKCCSPEDVMKYSKHADQMMFEAQNILSLDNTQPFSIITEVSEKKKCKYHIKVCTNVLCDNWIDNVKEKIRYGKGFDELVGGQNDMKKNFQSIKETSIRNIIDASFGDKASCLKRNEGFWAYFFCHKDNIFQIHNQIDVDIDLGTIMSVESEKFTIGFYDQESSESYLDENEIEHVYHPDGRPIRSNDEQDLRSLARQQVGAPGAYYSQEYTGGDICDGGGVTEWAKKAGKSFGADGYVMHRATTVRFFCGKRLELARIYEDNICHYIVDITIPGLCFHEYFDIPQVKKCAVKCLLVE